MSPVDMFLLLSDWMVYLILMLEVVILNEKAFAWIQNTVNLLYNAIADSASDIYHF